MFESIQREIQPVLAAVSAVLILIPPLICRLGASLQRNP